MAGQRQGDEVEGGEVVRDVRWQLRAAVVLAALLLTACAGGDDTPSLDDLAAQETEDATDEPTPGEGDEDELPDDAEEADVLPVDRAPDDASQIDEDYLDRVFEVLDARFGEIVAHVVDADGVDETGTMLLQTIYTEHMATFRADLLSGESRQFLREDPGAPSTDIIELRTAELHCVNVVAVKDMAPVFEDPGSPDNRWSITLEPAPTADNPTAWVIAGEQLSSDEIPPDGCAQIDRSDA